MNLPRLSFLALLIATFFVATLGPRAALAAEPPEQAFVKERHVALLNAIKSGDAARVDSLFDDMIDYQAIARDSLGDLWGPLTDAQKAQFVCILRNLVREAYRNDLKKTSGYTIDYLGVSSVPRGTLVKTTATKDGDVTAIDYTVYKVGNKFKVRDIQTEGVSLVGNYNSQFRRIIKKKGFEGLIQKMEEKLGERAKTCRPPS